MTAQAATAGAGVTLTGLTKSFAGEHGVVEAVRSIDRKPRPLVILFATMKDKEFEPVLSTLARLEPRAIVATTVGLARSAEPEAIAAAA